MARHLAREVEALKQRILFVGSLVEEAIAKAVHALVHRDADLARLVVDSDKQIDRLEVEVEEDCLKILALYQPVASDLRFVIGVLKMNNDLERIGDLAEGIAKKAAYLAQRDRIEMSLDLRPMAAKTQSMLKQSLDALVRGDAALARKIREEDDEVDSMRRQSLKVMEAGYKKFPDRADCLMRWTSVIRYLERIADMACNVAEDVIYMVEGDIIRHRKPD